MANTRRTCTGCGKTWPFEIGDEEKEQGLQIIWECPDYECGTRNVIEGITPHDLAVARLAPTPPGVDRVVDNDEATAGDQHEGG